MLILTFILCLSIITFLIYKYKVQKHWIKIATEHKEKQPLLIEISYFDSEILGQKFLSNLNLKSDSDNSKTKYDDRFTKNGFNKK